MNDAERIEILLNHVMVIMALVDGRTDKVTVPELKALLDDLEAKDYSALGKEDLVKRAIKALEQMKIVPKGLISKAVANNKVVHKASPLRDGAKGKAKSPRARAYAGEVSHDKEVRGVAKEWVKKTYGYAVPFVVAGALGYLSYKGYLAVGKRAAFNQWLEERDPGFLSRTKEALLGAPTEEALYQEFLDRSA